MKGTPSRIRAALRVAWRAVCCSIGIHDYGAAWILDARLGRRRRGYRCQCGKILRSNFDRPIF